MQLYNETTEACECPDGKSSLGVPISENVKCVACPANSEVDSKSTACKCKENYEPTWTKSTSATSCTTLIGTN